MGDVGWTPCNDWTTDQCLESAVRCFVQRLPESAVARRIFQGLPDVQQEDLDVCRCLLSFTNHVFRIRRKGCPGPGVILKMAAPKDEITDLSLPLERGQMENEALTFLNKVAPGCSPSPLFYDKEHHILCTEELHGHQPLSGAVLGGLFTDSGARALGAVLASIHAATHIITVGSDSLRDLTEQFPPREAMMALIKTYHFERPFDPCDLGRRCHPSVLTMLPEVLSDPDVIQAKEEAERSFLNDLECLIHGDLHIESVLVNGCDIKIIDAEFTRVGPCAFDMGLLLATLVLVFHRYRYVQCVAAREHQSATAEEKTLGFSSEEPRHAPSRPAPSVSVDSNRNGCSIDRRDDSTVLKDEDSNPNVNDVSSAVKDSGVVSKNAGSLARKRDNLALEDEDTNTNPNDGSVESGANSAFKADSVVLKDAGSFVARDDNRQLKGDNCPVLKNDDGQILEDHSTGDDGLADNDSDDSGDLTADDIIVKCSLLLEEYTARMAESLCQGDAGLVPQFQRALLHKVAAFTGCEILSCVIGPSHMDFMDSSPPAQRDCVRSALHLLQNRQGITGVADFVRLLAGRLSVIGPPHMHFLDSSPSAQRDSVLAALRLLRKRQEIICVADFIRLLFNNPTS